MLKSKLLSILGGAAALAMFAVANDASAVVVFPETLTITQADPHTLGPQSTSNPCIIAATQCQQPAGFGFNNFTSSGSISSFNMWSTTPTGTVADGVKGTPYTVGQLEAANTLGTNAFVVAIDVNTSSAMGETLQSFTVLDTTTNTVIAQFTGPFLIGTVSNNGNGFGDWALSTVDFDSLPTTDGILFNAVWNNASDGGESFFLVSAVPAPIIGHGLLVLLAVGGVLFGSKLLESLKKHRSPAAA